jgi:hypothetical protein
VGSQLAYLADIFLLLNELNISIQGQLKNVFTVRDKIADFHKKILLWQTRLAGENLQMFPNFNEYMKEDINRWVVALV